VTSAGAIKATSGKIGSWNITNRTISTIGNEEPSETINGTIGMSRTGFQGYSAENDGDNLGSLVFWSRMNYKYDNNHEEYALYGNRNGAYFAVNSLGKLYCKDAVIRGTIYAEHGEIGGWTIDEGELSYEDEEHSLSLVFSPTRVILPGLTIDQDGATFEGTIEAKSGRIGGWYITSTTL